MRGQDKQKKINAFVKAFSEDPLTAMKILFWVRDIRGGAGERQTFRDIMLYLVEKQVRILKKNMALIPEFGRWDDLLIFIGTRVEKEALTLIGEALKAGKEVNEILSKIDSLDDNQIAILLERFDNA